MMIKHKRMLILSTAVVLFLFCPNNSECCTSNVHGPQNPATTKAPTDTGNTNPSKTPDTNTETDPGN